jgi:hypothetical protein
MRIVLAAAALSVLLALGVVGTAGAAPPVLTFHSDFQPSASANVLDLGTVALPGLRFGFLEFVNTSDTPFFLRGLHVNGDGVSIGEASGAHCDLTDPFFDPGPLRPGESCTYLIFFAPTQPGVYTGSICEELLGYEPQCIRYVGRAVASGP